ncbi:low molecular weight phosphatase family protein [Myroides pelagicus]|uniref:Protein-tyrosine-phosphatase n=1 Tax=Myroides pelagicus TaxID=270914 RepID=A0A7K1GPL2_9FLAO|nr:protein-tyrosine-phosphatase [Myroides pelagicus]MEC4114656.1 protein-tyrosine-phosphatase [Myroides pelagicus]MTH30842.1 protein-tyrosine-phosphatase [Myroides pelagicus]
MYKTLENTIVQDIFSVSVTEERQRTLQPLIDYIQRGIDKEVFVGLNFICTHNSRRSVFAQIWAQVAADYYGLSKVCCFSGGTAVTATYRSVVKTLKKQGMQIQYLTEGENPMIGLKYKDSQHPLMLFSKLYDDAYNPISHFAAVMTCSQADEGCPFIGGADLRISMPFEDPKQYDNTPQEAEAYRLKSLEIASELFYVMAKINRR